MIQYSIIRIILMQKRENKSKTMVVKVIGNNTTDGPYRIDLPAYEIIRELNRRPDGTFPPGGGRVMISVPDDCCDDNGELDNKKIRQKYRGSRWDRPDVGNGVETNEEEKEKEEKKEN